MRLSGVQKFMLRVAGQELT